MCFCTLPATEKLSRTKSLGNFTEMISAKPRCAYHRILMINDFVAVMALKYFFTFKVCPDNSSYITSAISWNLE
jgi:hypothetical protein